MNKYKKPTENKYILIAHFQILLYIIADKMNEAKYINVYVFDRERYHTGIWLFDRENEQ